MATVKARERVPHAPRPGKRTVAPKRVSQNDSAMATMTIVKAREQFADVVNRTAYGKERVVITRRGKELGGFVPIEDIRLLEQIENEIDLRESDLALKDARKHGTKPFRQLLKELGI